MGEIITYFASAGFIIEKLVEGPRFDSHQNIPGEFTLIAQITFIVQKIIRHHSLYLIFSFELNFRVLHQS